MNRREAIAALMALPAVERIAVARLEPNDVIVVECDAAVTQEAAERIKATMSGVFPARKIIVMDKSIRMRVARG